MEYAKREKSTGFMGKSEYIYKPTDYKNDYVVISKEEFEKLEADKNRLERWYESEKRDHDADVAKAQQVAEEFNRVKEDLETANQCLEDMKKAAQKQIEAAEAERDKQISLNQNLLRICRERANAKRGLRPKKSHCGYRLSGKILPVRRTVQDEDGDSVVADAWMATLETPYNATIPLAEVEDLIDKDLMGDDGILGKLHVSYVTWKANGKIVTQYSSVAKWQANNGVGACLFDRVFMANARTRLWEVQIFATGPIQASSDVLGR